MTYTSSQILLVDDEPRLLAALRRRLSESFTVLTANSGKDALSCLDDNPEIKVIISDMQMPEMNGIELLMSVKEKFPLVRRVMLTGNADMETAIAAINDGQVMRFLRKPCDIKEISALLRQGIDEYNFQVNSPNIEDTQDLTTPGTDHENNTLGSILNSHLKFSLTHLATLSNQLPKESVQDVSLETISLLTQNSEYLLDLVKSVGVYSRLDKKNASAHEPRSFDILYVVTNEIKNLQTETKAKSITVSTDCLRRKVEVIGNPHEIQLAIRELLRNAIRSSRHNGHISIAVKCDGNIAAIRLFCTAGCSLDTTPLQHKMIAEIARINNASFKVDTNAKDGTLTWLFFNRPAFATAA